ncbi:MAG: hypothetical protein ACT4P3_09490 [Betaproteobacteria bacterium]
MAPKDIRAADAVKLFRNVKVQIATPVTVKGEDGKERPGFKTEDVALAAEHVLSARRYEDGRVAIVTIDGRKHEARA